MAVEADLDRLKSDVKTLAKATEELSEVLMKLSTGVATESDVEKAQRAWRAAHRIVIRP